MTRLPLLALLLLPGLAGATSQGESAFNAACARCHTAGPLAPQAGDKGGKAAANAAKAQAQAPANDKRTNLVELMRHRKPAQVRAWIEAPTKVRRDTDCDTRLLDHEDIGAVMSYVMLSARPAGPSRKELLSQERRKGATELRQQEQQRQEQLRKLRATTPASTPTNSTTSQGKK
jgi:mono/diheme cytochrome c family protein